MKAITLINVSSLHQSWTNKTLNELTLHYLDNDTKKNAVISDWLLSETNYFKAVGT